MKSRATVLGHPAHQVLVMFPLGMLAFSTGCDALGLATGKRHWFKVSESALTAGIAGAALAAPFGLVDWLAIPEGTRAKRVGKVHGLGNAAVLGLFLGSWVLKKVVSRKSSLAAALSFAGFGLAGVTAWLGGELVNRLGVGVYTPTNLDATSSLRESPAVATVANAAWQVANINP